MAVSSFIGRYRSPVLGLNAMGNQFLPPVHLGLSSTFSPERRRQELVPHGVQSQHGAPVPSDEGRDRSPVLGLNAMGNQFLPPVHLGLSSTFSPERRRFATW